MLEKLAKFSVFLFLASAAPPFAHSQVIVTGHPRIYVTAWDVPVLKEKCQGPMKDVYAELLKAKKVLAPSAGTDWSDCINANYAAFMHLMTGEKQYLNKCKAYLDALTRRWPRDKFLLAEWVPTGGMLLDWIWNDLDRKEREKYADTLLDMAEHMLNRVGRHSDFSNQFVLEQVSVLYVGVALQGESIETARVERVLTTGSEYLLKHAMPAANEIAGGLAHPRAAPARAQWYLAKPSSPGQTGPCFVGGQAEGFTYNDWGYARPLALTVEMWRVATGEDLFSNSSFFRGQGIWHAYGLRGDNGSYARSEDCPSGARPGAHMKMFMHLLAARLADPLAEWVAQKASWSRPQRGWMEILWRDPELKPVSPAQMHLPPAALFGTLGHCYFRGGWGAGAGFALFQCGPFYGGHQHLDNNTFVIHRKGSLAIDSGANEYSRHRGNYYCRTIAHNGILVYDPTERFGGGTWGGGGSGGSNGGGQLRVRGIGRAGQFTPGCPSDTGRIVAFATGNYCAGVAGDASGSYWPRKVTKALRAFYHLRPGPDGTETFAVYDYVALAKETLTPKWIVHSINKPTVEGGSFVISQAQGRLVGQVILPADAKIDLIGGPGREFFVDGRNYPPDSRKDPEAGSWRIEIELPANKMNQAEALILLHASPSADKKPAPVVGPLVARRVSMTTIDRQQRQIKYVLRLGDIPGVLPTVDVTRRGRIIETLTLIASPKQERK